MAATDYKPSTIEAQRQGIVKALDPEDGAYRLEIDEFVQNGHLLNLFLLALESLQNNDVLTKVKNYWKNVSSDEEKKKFEEDLSNNERYWWSYFVISSDLPLCPCGDRQPLTEMHIRHPWFSKATVEPQTCYQRRRLLLSAWNKNLSKLASPLRDDVRGMLYPNALAT